MAELPKIVAVAPSSRTIIEAALQDLINTRHLYQSVTIDFAAAFQDEAKEMHLRRLGADLPPVGSSPSEILDGLLREADQQDWCLVGSEPNPVRKIPFSFPPVRTLCSACEDVEPFNLNGAQVISLGKHGEQIFSFTVQCQRCKDCVIVLLVKRRGRKIQLVGRSEFEQVLVPPFIPKALRDFYSQAVIASRCGQILPGLFLLRTLIEQHMRSAIANQELRGEPLCDEYAKTLSADFNSRFPSLKSIYSKLSDALHRADPNEELFKSQLADICMHFEALALFAKVESGKSKTDTGVS